jgi:hypothetical protein
MKKNHFSSCLSFFRPSFFRLAKILIGMVTIKIFLENLVKKEKKSNEKIMHSGKIFFYFFFIHSCFG